jgi:hypothetical protein
VLIGGPLANVAINSFTAAPDLDAGAVSLVVAATNYGGTAVTGPVVISAGDRVLARRTISVPASDSASVAFSLPSVSGLLSARLDAADALEADNTRYALAPATQTTRAVMFGSSPFLEKALAALPGVGVAAPIANDKPDLVICAGCDSVPQEYARAHVLLLPSASQPAEAPAPIIVTSHSHPLLALVDPSGLLVTPLSNGAALEESDVLMRAAGHPVLAAYTNHGRRVVEMRFDPSRSPLATHAAFPLLVAASVSWLSADRLDWVSGEPIRLLADGVTGVRGPDEQSIGYVVSGDDVIVGQTTAAGLYRIATAIGEVSVVVNPASHVESDLSSPALTSTRTATASARRSRGDVSWVLLLGALAVLAGEWRMQAGWRR